MSTDGLNANAIRKWARELFAKSQHGKTSSLSPNAKPRLSREAAAAIVRQFLLEQKILTVGRPPTVRGVKTRAVRLDQETEDILTRIAKEWECNHSEAIRRIIRNYDGTLRKSKKSPAAVR